VENLVLKSREHLQKDQELYDQLFQILPSIVAKVKEK